MGMPPKTAQFTARPAGAQPSAPGGRTAAPHRPDRRRHLGLFWLALIGWLGILAVTVGAAAGLLALYRSDLILPGVSVMGMELGGMTTSEAAEQLQDRWRAREIVLDVGDAVWTTSPEALGVTLDAGALAGVARQQGRELAMTAAGADTLDQIGDAISQLTLLGGRLLGLAPAYMATRGITAPAVEEWLAELNRRLPPPAPVALAPIWRFDRRQAAATLRAFAAQIDVPPRDAELRITDGQAEARPSRAGRALDLTAALGQLEAAPWQIVSAGRLAIRSVDIPPQIPDVSAAAAEINRHLTTPITIRLYDPIVDERLAWTIRPEVMAGWISFSLDAAAAGAVTWTADADKIAAYLAVQAETLGEGRRIEQTQAVSAIHTTFMSSGSAVALRIYHGTRQHIVQEGETLSSIAQRHGFPYPWLLAANPDLGDTLFVGQAVTVPSPDDLLPLPVVEHKRIEISLGQQRMWAYEDGALKWEWSVSTGIASSPTSPGVFQVQSHEPNAYAASWDLWMPYFMGIYQPAPGQAFMNGFHGFPTRDQRQLLWTRSLGHPVTYGCILLSTENARLLYEWAEEGVVVAIRS